MVYVKGDKRIGVGNLPNNKRKCLYLQDGCVIRKVASFSSDKDAAVFEKMLEYFLGIDNKVQDEIKE